MKVATRLILLLPAGLVLLVLAYGVLLSRSDEKAAQALAAEELARENEATARTGAAFLDPAAHKAVSLALDAAAPEWKTIHAGLERIAGKNGLAPEQCYTFARPSADLSRLNYAVMLHAKPFAGQTYQVPAERQPLLKTLVAEKEPESTGIYRDDRGEWLSTLSPILTAEGEITGILAIDRSAADALSRARATLEARRFRILLQGVLLAIVVALATLFHAWRSILRPLQAILAYAQALERGRAPGGLAVRAEGDIGILGRALESVNVRIVEMVAAARQSSEAVADLTSKLADAAKLLAQDASAQSRAAQHTSSFVVKVDKSAQSVSQSSSSVTNLVIETTAALEEMMAQVREIDRSAASLMSSTNVTASSIQEMGANIAEVAQNAETLTEQVADASVAVEEMGRSIQSVDRSARDLLQAAERTSDTIQSSMDSIRGVEKSAQESEKLTLVVLADAENGRARVRSTIEGMDAIRRAIAEVVEVISHLEQSGQRIGDILDLIEKVAGQTNVLALNAALIAAHAGEQGKAFGVVAAKIRELSASTSERTKDIAKLVAGVKGDVSQATAVAQRAVKSVERGAAFASEAGVALDKILDSAREASRLAEGIAKTTVDQIVLGVQMAEAMDKVRTLVADISRATDEEGRVSMRLVETMDSVREKAGLFKRATVELRTGSVQILTAIDNVAAQVKEISRATAEQARGGKSITRAVAEMEKSALALTNSAADQSRDSQRAVDAVVEIGEIVSRNSSRVQEIDQAVSVLLQESQKLLKDVSALAV